MPSNSFSRRRGNWRRPAVCESKKKALEEPQTPAPRVTVHVGWDIVEIGFDFTVGQLDLPMIHLANLAYSVVGLDIFGRITLVQVTLVPGSFASCAITVTGFTSVPLASGLSGNIWPGNYPFTTDPGTILPAGGEIGSGSFVLDIASP